MAARRNLHSAILLLKAAKLVMQAQSCDLVNTLLLHEAWPVHFGVLQDQAVIHEAYLVHVLSCWLSLLVLILALDQRRVSDQLVIGGQNGAVDPIGRPLKSLLFLLRL